MDWPYQLAVVDVDDTLLGPDKKLSDENRFAIARLRNSGCRVVLASGRRHENMLRYYGWLGLDDFVVSCQGARVQHVRDERCLHRAPLAPDMADRLIGDGEDLGFSVVAWTATGIYATASSHWVDAYGSETGGELVGIAAEPQGTGPMEKLVWLGEPRLLADTLERYRRDDAARLAITLAHDWCVEFAHPNANKAFAAAAVARETGTPPESVVAFGDGYNDVPLLRWAGLGIGMAHGRPCAREAADHVAPPGDPATALARAVEELFADHGLRSGAGWKGSF